MIARYTLKNGIPVFIVETNASPVVSIQAWVSRGSAYETPEEAGISHFLEHALFKGTKRRKVGEIASEIESRGGDINAFTSFEETCYYTTLASRYFKEGLDIITDAVRNPLFDAEEMLREREVILEEIKRAHDSAHKLLSMNLWKTCFAGTPYGRPVLGFEETVRKIDHKKLRGYFDKNYHAGTISLFIVGDVDKKLALELAKKQLGTLAKKPGKTIPNNRPKIKNKIQVVSAAKDLKECHLQIAWPAPAITDSRIPAWDVLCTALGQGESSRLFQSLVKEKQVALDCHMGLVATAKHGLATLGLQVAPEKLEAALEATMDLLTETTRVGVQDSALERVKTSLESEVVSGKETVEGMARRLGYYFIQFGDPEYEKKYLESVLAVEKEETTQALVEILKTKPVVSWVHPNDFKFDSKKIAATLSRKAAKAPKVVKPEKSQLELKNRGSIRFVEKVITTLPIVALKILFPGGSREESNDKLGVGQLFQRLWGSGTASYNSLELAHTLESLGASIHAFSGKHTLGLSIEFLSKQWPTIKPLLSEILLKPTFPEDEFQTEKNILLRDILSERDSPGNVCQLNLMNAIYGNHPYGRSALGTEQTVEKLTRADLQRYYSDYVHQGKVVISTVGAFHKDSWEGELQRMIEQLPKSGKPVTPALVPESIKHLQIIAEQKNPLFQAHVLVGFLSSDFKDVDRYAMKLLSSCLAGQGGRLFLELRDKQSLAYTVSPMNTDTPERGVFGFYIGCSPEKTITAIRGIRTELQRVLDQPMTERELDRAKRFWIGRFELDTQRFSSQAMLYGLDEIYGIGYQNALKLPEIISSVSREQIQQAAQRLLNPLHATLSIVHPEKLDKQLIENAWLLKANPVKLEVVRAKHAAQG